MLDGFSWTVLLGALGVAVLHTAVGPDHYVPFVALARARRWSRGRTLTVTAACGLAHVLGSLVLVGGVLVLGASLGLLEALERGRGAIAAWGLVAFGLAYAAWGARRSWRERRGLGLHRHGGHVHVHPEGGRDHEHAGERRDEGTFWALFAVFVLGPCEPLIPLVFLPAADGRWALAAATAVVFGTATVLTMIALVAAARAGLHRLSLGFLERWAHAAAGLLLAASGLGMLLGL